MAARSEAASLHVSPWWPTALLLLVCVQGAFGAWTVTLKLQPVIVTHAPAAGLGCSARSPGSAARHTPIAGRTTRGRALRRPRPGRAGARCCVQIALGGWVSTNYAALACTDFPLCGGQWMPAMDFEHGFHLWRALGKTADGD